jgi:uncharacterized protein (DUF58 family)
VSQSLTLRAQAETLGAGLPPLLAAADQLAGTVILGDHGRRRSGMGDIFWQYRPATASDAASRIDWRRSARSDSPFVQDKEWQIAQTLQLWVNASPSMDFTSRPDIEPKSRRARLLGLAIAILLLRGGERVGLTDTSVPPRRGEIQAARLAEALAIDGSTGHSGPDSDALLPRSRALFISDFLEDLDPVEKALGVAADRGIKGVLLQVLDPAEEDFPFAGRTVFENMTGAITHETLSAADLRARYLDRLAERKDRLDQLARHAGWTFATHHTGQPATSALLWLHGALAQS